MMDATGTKPALGDLKAAFLTQQHIFGRHAHIGKAQMIMPMRRVIMAVNLHGPQFFNPRCRSINDDHRMALMFGRILRPGFHHNDIDRTARIPRATRPPFFTVEHIIIAIPPAAQA